MNSITIYLINNIKTLNLLKEKLQKAKIIAIDTEFTRKNTYYPKPSLIQVCCSDNEAFIADFISNKELFLEVIELIQNSKLTKVFHASKNDLEIFYVLTKKIPTPIFDTQIAYMALNNVADISYAKLVKEILNIEISKELTTSNWNKRPLLENQLNYAAYDVVYLYKLYFKIKLLLKKKKRIKWIEDKLLEPINEINYNYNLSKQVYKYATEYNLKNNIKKLSKILQWRDTKAREFNIPRQQIIDNNSIKKILRADPNKEIINLNIKHYHKVQLKDLEHHLNKDVSIELQEQPTKVPLNSYQKHFLYIIELFLEFLSNKLKIHPDLITNKTEIRNYVISPNNTFSFSSGWRYKVFGKPLKKLLKGKLVLTIKNNKIIFK